MPAYKENLVSLDTLLTFSPAPDKAAEKTKLDDEAKRRENLTPPTPPDPEPTQTEEVT
jgi:hypothetical protein